MVIHKKIYEIKEKTEEMKKKYTRSKPDKRKELEPKQN